MPSSPNSSYPPYWEGWIYIFVRAGGIRLILEGDVHIIKVTLTTGRYQLRQA